MSLLFGNLTEDFVVFGDAASIYYGDLQTGNATAIAAAQQALDAAVAEFRQSAAADATYLVYIGEPLRRLVQITPDKIPRYRYVRVYLYLHGHLGIHRRGQLEAYSRKIPSSDVTARHSIL
jgi:hypothetical protein